MRTLTDVFVPGAPTLPEGLRTLAVSPERELEPGMTVRAAFTFRNQGGAVATGVRVRFNLPEGLVYLVGSGQLDGNELDDEQGNSPLLSRSGAHIGDVAPGEERRIDIAYSVAGAIENGTPIELQAAVASFEVPPVGSNIVRLVVRSRPALANPLTNVAIEARHQPRPGSDATITVRIHNAGESSAHDVILVAPVPEHTTYIPNSLRVNGREFERELLAPFDRIRAALIAPSLSAGATATLQYRVRIDDPLQDGTIVVARAQLASQETPAFDLEPAGLTVRAKAEFGDERTFFTVDPEREAAAGSKISFRFAAYNAGTTTAEGVVATLRFPEPVVPVRGSFKVDGKPLRERKREAPSFELGNIAVRDSVELSGEAMLTSPIDDGTALQIQAALRWSSGGDQNEDRYFEHTITVRSQPYFSARRNRIVRHGEAVVAPSGECEATIELCNDGTAAATEARVRIASDPGVENLAVLEAGAKLKLQGDLVELDRIEPYTSRELTLRCRVRTPYPDRSDIRLRAYLECAELAETGLGESVWRVDSHPLFTAESSNLQLGADDVFRPNQLVEVNIRLRNEGTDVAGNVRLRLHLSPEAKLESVEGATRDRTSLLFGEIGAGASAEARLGVRLLRGLAKSQPVTIEALLTADGMLPVQLQPLTIVTTAEANFSVGTLRSEPADFADAGDEVEYILHVRNSGDGPARRVKIFTETLNELIYLPNSTAVNGMPVRDAGSQSPICSEQGILLTDVDPGVDATIRWREVVHTGLVAGDAIVRRVTILCDDDRQDEIVAEELKVRSSPAFANTIAGLPFGLEGMLGPAFGGGQRALSESGERLLQLPPATPMSSAESVSAAAVAFSPRSNGQSSLAEDVDQSVHTIVSFDRDQLDKTLKFLAEARFGGLATHLFVLRAFFAERAGSGADENLHQVRLGLRETLDRLFIKLRLPNYVIAPRDLETLSSRASLLSLLDSIEPAQVMEGSARSLSLHGTCDLVELRVARERLEKAPLATAMPWSAMARFLPNQDDAASNYRRLLIASLDDLAAVDETSFVDALQRRPYPVLDGALDVMLASITVRS